jgi:Ca2+-binding EF-hand superfamily protein
MLWLRMLHCGLLLGACSFALLGAGCAGTLLGPSDIEGAFNRAARTWDLNRDGKITCEEWWTYAASLFKQADSDHNGKLTREEFAKLPKIDRLFEVANFDYYDVNKQGYVTQADFVDRPNPAFAALDQDKSCVIYLSQFDALNKPPPPKQEKTIEEMIERKERCVSCMRSHPPSCQNTFQSCQEIYPNCAYVCRD